MVNLIYLGSLGYYLLHRKPIHIYYSFGQYIYKNIGMILRTRPVYTAKKNSVCKTLWRAYDDTIIYVCLSEKAARDIPSRQASTPKYQPFLRATCMNIWWACVTWVSCPPPPPPSHYHGARRSLRCFWYFWCYYRRVLLLGRELTQRKDAARGRSLLFVYEYCTPRGVYRLT